MTLNEVSPPGFGHTKGDKEKGIKKGGTAAAFDKARKEGRFKGSKSDMFAIMWSQKNKGDKPHYKPGTDKKYKKYQDEAFGFEIDKGEHKKASKKAKMRNLAKGNTNPNEKAAAEKKAGGPKLYGEDKEMPFVSRKDRGAIRKRAKNLFKRDIKGEHHGVNEGVGREEMTYQEAIDAGWEMTADGFWWPPQPETVTEKISFPTFRKKVKERKPQKAQDAGSKARRAMKRREHAKYVSGSEDNVPDDIRD